MHPKGENSMAMSGPSFRNTLVGTGWAISLILCIGDPRKHSPSPCRAPFLAVKVIPSLEERLLAES